MEWYKLWLIVAAIYDAAERISPFNKSSLIYSQLICLAGAVISFIWHIA